MQREHWGLLRQLRLRPLSFLSPAPSLKHPTYYHPRTHRVQAVPTLLRQTVDNNLRFEAIIKACIEVPA